LQSLEHTPALQLDRLPTDVDAIVVLSGGTYCNAPEYGKDTVSPYTLPGRAGGYPTGPPTVPDVSN
jgi:hypothetical protein